MTTQNTRKLPIRIAFDGAIADGGENFKGGDWRNCSFLNVSFKNANVAGAKFTARLCVGANFSGANLANTQFYADDRATVVKPVFSGDKKLQSWEPT